MPKAGDEPARNRISSCGEDNWDGTGRLLGGQGRRRACRHDDIDLERNQFRRESGETIEVPLGRSVLDHEVAALYVTEVSQSVTEGPSLLRVSGQVGRQVAYSNSLGRWLGYGGERYDDDAPGEHRHEGATLHHWVITQVFREPSTTGWA